jgi:hypothetical protein
MSTDHDDVGAWVLGALTDEEAERFGTHLRTCEQCRSEVGELQAVVDALGAAVPPVRAPAPLKRRLMATVEAEAELLQAAGQSADRPARPRRRWPRGVVPGFALAGTLAAGLLVGDLALGGSSPAIRTRAFAAMVTAPGARAVLRESGSRAELDVAGMPAPPAGKIYQVWLVRPGRAPLPTRTLFSVTADGSGAAAVSGALGGVRRVLVTPEPVGGSLRPTAAPVISVALA